MRLLLKRRPEPHYSLFCAGAVRSAIADLPSGVREVLRFGGFASLANDALETLQRDTPANYREQARAALDRYYFIDGIPPEESEALVERLALTELFELCRMDRAPGNTEMPRPIAVRSDQPVPQPYLKEAPVGVDSYFAKSKPGGDGESITFIAIERGFRLPHPDLASVKMLRGNLDTGPEADGPHGTAMLGILCSLDDGAGTVGLVPKAHARTMVAGSEAEIAAAIVAGAASVRKGSILLVAAQTESHLPSETNEIVFDAIQLAVAARRIVVEAAGDGGIDFDSYEDAAGRQILNPSSADFRNSGAILVAGCKSEKRARAGGSNYGSRVDCYGWSEEVASTFPPNRYAHASGTAAATAIVGGCAVAVQGMYRSRVSKAMDPPELRNLMVRSGTHPVRLQDKIGTMPDLRRAFAAID